MTTDRQIYITPNFDNIMITNDSMNKGKAIEHYFISELLKNDFEIFVPVLDKGIDLIIKDREGGLVEVQVKSRVIKNGDDCFTIKDFSPKENFFIICHNISKDEYFCMPSKTFYEKSESYAEENRTKRKLPYSILIKHKWCINGKGIDLLKKALDNPHNKINRFL